MKGQQKKKRFACASSNDEWAQPRPLTLRSLIPITDDSSSQMTGSTSLGLFSSVRLLTGIQSLDLTGASGATAPADRVECVECRLGCFSRSLIVDGAGCWYNLAKDRKLKSAEYGELSLSWPACESERGRGPPLPRIYTAQIRSRALMLGMACERSKMLTAVPRSASLPRVSILRIQTLGAWLMQQPIQAGATLRFPCSRFDSSSALTLGRQLIALSRPGYAADCA